MARVFSWIILAIIIHITPFHKIHIKYDLNINILIAHAYNWVNYLANDFVFLVCLPEVTVHLTYFPPLFREPSRFLSFQLASSAFILFHLHGICVFFLYSMFLILKMAVLLFVTGENVSFSQIFFHFLQKWRH